MSVQKRTSYEAGFKLKVVAYAEETNNSAAARRFSVNEKQVRMWRKNQKILERMPKHKKAARGLSAKFPQLEEQLSEWVHSLRQNGIIVTRTMIRFRAISLMKRPEFQSLKPSKFVASSGWCTRFMERHNLCLRQRTKIAQKLPQDLEGKIEEFQRYVIRLRKNYNFGLDQIGNMDETPVCFDMPFSHTVDKKGVKSVLVRTTGHEKTRFTVVLCCMANGYRLPPIVIFKRKTLPKGVKFPSGVIVWAHENGWMDEKGTLDWLEKVWNARPGACFKKPSLLVWDSFRAHITSDVVEKAEKLKTSVAVIPGGLTSILQPLDVSINKAFKHRLRAKWIEWMQEPNKALTKKGNLRKADIVTITRWVKEAWSSIPESMIVKAFKKCCVSNAMDGSEDDAVFEIDEEELSEPEEDDLYTDEPMTEGEFRELFGDSDSDSEFSGF